MRVSIEITPYRWSAPESERETIRSAIAAVVEAERAGFDAAWASEDPDSWDAIAVLSAAAAQTERIGMATGVVNPFYRHPALLAASFSTLDRISRGRARMGLGRGQVEWYQRSLGIETREPLRRLEEAILLLRQWWREPYVATSDGPLGVAAWERGFGPLQARLPIILAAAGPKAVDLAGRLADGILFNELTSADAMRRLIAAARAAAAGVGRDPGSLTFIARPGLVITDDPEPVLERLKTRIAMINTLPGMGRLIETEGFDVPRILDAVRRVMRIDDVLAEGGAFADVRRAGDLEAARSVVPSALINELAIVGSIDHVRQRITRLQGIGVDEIVMNRRDLPRSGDHGTLVEALKSC
jgi:5,10-methylenetetrahydromethanopterin reductase